jgi:hypothetical protein
LQRDAAVCGVRAVEPSWRGAVYLIADAAAPTPRARGVTEVYFAARAIVAPAAAAAAAALALALALVLASDAEAAVMAFEPPSGGGNPVSTPQLRRDRRDISIFIYVSIHKYVLQSMYLYRSVPPPARPALRQRID